MRTIPSQSLEEGLTTVSLKNLSSGELKSAVIGMVIGDGCLSKRKGDRNAYYQMNHSAKQYEYMMWKGDILEQVSKCTVHPNDHICSFNEKEYEAYHLMSRCNPIYTSLYNRFYFSGKKCVDEYLVKMITPLALSIMYMDDGTLGEANPKYWTKESFFLRLCNFDYANLFLIKKSLKIKFDLDWNISIHSKNYYQLRLLNRDNDRFVEIVLPYMKKVPSMIYKLGSYANTLKDVDTV